MSVPLFHSPDVPDRPVHIPDPSMRRQLLSALLWEIHERYQELNARGTSKDRQSSLCIQIRALAERYKIAERV